MPGGKGQGARGKRKESSEGAEEDLAGVPSPRFELATPLLGFHRKQLYAGKAVKRRRRGEAWQYLVHYNGWGSKYDEWLNEDLLYPDTEESRRVADSLRSSAEQQEKQRRSGKDDADALAEDVEGEHVIQIIIPHTLQTHLLKEADFVKDGKVLVPPPPSSARVRAAADGWEGYVQATHREPTCMGVRVTRWRCPSLLPQVVPLPRKPCVRQVLSDFIAWKAETCQDMLGVEKEILRDMTDSIISYFDKALGMVLLYKEERAQYNKWR